MSVEVIQQQIERFLSSEAPEVMSIKGDWGVGKTYAWNKYLSFAKNKNKIALPKYSYVSLFGINSLSDLKFAIFENIVENKLIGRKPTLESFKSNTAELISQFSKKSFPLAQGNRSFEPYHGIFDTLLFLSLEKTIICIDDFERKGQGIAAQDIMGLISLLKEQKKCKIVLILNDESLGDDSSVDYVKLREKVIDTELRFAPTADECVGIALTNGRLAHLLGSYVMKLKISNIRILKKIEKLAGQLVNLLKDYDDPVLDRAMRTVTLLTWCYYSQSSDVPDLNFVLGRSNAFGELDDDGLSTQQQGWCSVLRHYDNYVFDEFDTQIARLVENGFLNEQRLYADAALFSEKNRQDKSQSSFQAAWAKFNDSFDDNAQEVIDNLSDSFKHGAKYISPANLDGAVRLLRYLGRDKLATRIIDLYIEKRQDEIALFNLDNGLLNGNIKDPEVVAKFERQFESMRGQHSLEDLCERLLDGNPSRDEEEILLSQAPIVEYIDLFKGQKEPNLSRYIDLCLKFGRQGGATEHQEMIADKATAALKRIGRESKLNASRVRRFGISVD